MGLVKRGYGVCSNCESKEQYIHCSVVSGVVDDEETSIVFDRGGAGWGVREMSISDMEWRRVVKPGREEVGVLI